MVVPILAERHSSVAYEQDWDHAVVPSHPLPLAQLAPMRAGNSHLYMEGSRKVCPEAEFT